MTAANGGRGGGGAERDGTAPPGGTRPDEADPRGGPSPASGTVPVDAALARTADAFGGRARETLLFENRGKHALEIGLILRHLRPLGRLLDVGGGLGVNLQALRTLGRTDSFLCLLDRFREYTPDNRMGSAQRGLELLRRAEVAVVEQDVVRTPGLPFADASFDVVTLFDVVEHLPRHPLALLREIRRVLVPAGTLLLSGPNAVSLTKRLRMLAGIHPYGPLDSWLEEPFFEHYREYTSAEYGRLLREAGYTVRRTILSSEPWPTRARFRYHRRRHGALSATALAIRGVGVLEAAWPGWRHSVYCVAQAPIREGASEGGP